MFNIGDVVWVPKYGNNAKYVTCPECLGNKYLTCILGDGSQITFDCECCRDGWVWLGKIRLYEWSADVEIITITGLEVNTKDGKQIACYRSDCRIYDDVFSTKEEALAFAENKVIEHNNDEQDRIANRKENSRKSWAWNTTYHQKQIRNLEKQLAYHQEKLTAANPKAEAQKKVKK